MSTRIREGGEAGRDWTELEEVVRTGCPSARCRSSGVTPWNQRETASAFVYRIVPAATFKLRQRLSPAESERTERVARVAALAKSL